MNKISVFLLTLTLVVFLTCGCEQQRRKSAELAPTMDLGATVGSVAEVLSYNSIDVKSYNLVGGLRGNGSSQCPSHIRGYLEKYILRQLPHANAEQLISSRDTAVVLVYGKMPASVLKNERFDIVVAALPGTQAISIEGGELWGAELFEAQKFGVALTPLATAQGPVYIDKIDSTKADKKVGYILGGAKVLDTYKMSLVLREPDYKKSNFLRNLLNSRFGDDTAEAISESMIQLTVPPEYVHRKDRFLAVVKMMYLSKSAAITNERINTAVRKLAVEENKYEHEITLEAIGNESLDKLGALLNSADEEVRLRAGRCMLNMRSDAGLDALREIEQDRGSIYRIEALDAVTNAAARSDAAAIARRLLRDEDFTVMIAAYKSLLTLDDLTIMRSLVGRNFYLEEISQAHHKGIYVSRSGPPRVALFGSPMRCRENLFIQTPDGSVTINAPAGQKFVSIVRKWPGIEPIQLKSTFMLDDIIRTLCDSMLVREGSSKRPGLGVSYADLIALLKQMCEKGALEDEFRAGDLPKIFSMLKN